MKISEVSVRDVTFGNGYYDKSVDPDLDKIFN